MNEKLSASVLCLILVLVVKAEEFTDDQRDGHILSQDFRTGRQENWEDLSNWLASIPNIGLRVNLNKQCKTSNGISGRCMTMNECYPNFKLFPLKAHETWAMGLYNTCTVKAGRNGVQVYGTCCPNNKADEERASKPRKKPGKVRNQTPSCLLTEDQIQSVLSSRCVRDNTKDGEQLSITPKMAGESKNLITGSPRITGGIPAKRNEFKFMATLVQKQYSGIKKKICGGSLIDDYHVLTASHCVMNFRLRDLPNLEIWLGHHDDQSLKSNATSVIKVSRVIRHKGYSSAKIDNDVAIITLAEKAPSDATITPICLPNATMESYEGFEATVAGWGTTSPYVYPSELRKVNVRVWKNSACKRRYTEYESEITPRQICANGTPGKDSCHGDSGGPLFTCNGDEKCTQIGVVSWGHETCGLPNYPGVYTRVTELKEWIRRISSCY